MTWRRLADPRTAALSGAWLLVVPGTDGTQEWVEGAAAALTSAGAQVITVHVPTGTADRGSVADAIRVALADQDATLAGVLSLLALDETPHSAFPLVAGGNAALLALVQALSDIGIEVPLWSATRGAVAAVPGEPLASAVQAQAWGLGRVIALEYPHMWGGSVDLPERPSRRTLARLASVLTGRDREDGVAIRGSGLLTRRVERARLGGARPARAYRPEGTMLITGGTGGLGSHVARWAARNGAAHLLLISRRGSEAPGADELSAELTELGARVTIAACDIGDREALAEEIARIPEDVPLTAVVHTAAVLDNGVVDALNAERLAHTLRVKAHGALNLHELTRDMGLSAFVLFSSFASVFGIPGMGNYVPGNAYLEALAEQRRAAGLPATAISWGTWTGAGMAEGNIGERARRHGMLPMDPGQALAALQQSLDHEETHSVIVDVDWDRFAVIFTSERPSKLLNEVPEARRALAAAGNAPQDESADGETKLAARLRPLPVPEQERELVQLVRANAAQVLGHDSPDGIDPARAFRQTGFDSLAAVELRNRLNATTGLQLPASLVFDYPTPLVLSQYLRGELLGEDTAPEPGEAQVGAVTLADEPIAIVGMACRYPGGVSSPEDLWQVIAEGGDVISSMPTNRGWDLSEFYSSDPEAKGKSYAREGGFLHDADEFDADLFGISPREALAMDPQQRLFIEASWEVFERAGIDVQALRGSRTGVFTGLTHREYGRGTEGTPAHEGLEGYRVTGNIAAVASGRVAYTFGFEGPAVTVDTACSSSLVALHLAVQAVRQGECSMAVAGGVAVMPEPHDFVSFSRQRGLSRDGRCRAFGEGAEGFGLAEGVGVLLVERLSEARRNGHRVLAVVKGSAINQDGASNGLTAPNGPSQQRVIRQALANARLSAGQVDVVEAHGTGTKLGDPIEAQALLATYGQSRSGDRP
ncbi:type I polyketide synthase, partial [Streptomyces sp. DSM 41886]